MAGFEVIIEGVAEFLFETVWRTMANLFAVFIASHFNDRFTIEEIPIAERNPANPRRFRWVLRAAGFSENVD
jgi:hypothetical protein